MSFFWGYHQNQVYLFHFGQYQINTTVETSKTPAPLSVCVVHENLEKKKLRLNIERVVPNV